MPNPSKLFQAPLDLDEILDYIAKWDAQNPVRKTRAFDFFSGYGNVGSVYRAAGHRCLGVDNILDGLQDLINWTRGSPLLPHCSLCRQISVPRTLYHLEEVSVVKAFASRMMTMIVWK